MFPKQEVKLCFNVGEARFSAAIVPFLRGFLRDSSRTAGSDDIEL